jgi:hypothetical protein
MRRIYLRRIKGTKCFDIWVNDLAWKKGRLDPGKFGALSILAGVNIR